ncbi:MAG: hypothetical protein HRF44_06870 [Ignavibacterium sp.]
MNLTSSLRFLSGVLHFTGCQPRTGDDRVSSEFPLKYFLVSINQRAVTVCGIRSKAINYRMLDTEIRRK